MAVGNAASSPSVLWDGGGGGGGGEGQQTIQLYSTSRWSSTPLAGGYYQAEMLVPETSSYANNSYSKYATNGQAGQSGYQNPECGPYPLTDDAGNSNRQLRRWSDGSNARFSKTEADALREEQQLQLQLQLQNTKGNPKASDFYLQNAKNQPYLPNCECSHCRARKPRPKVSFGPSQMYGPEGSGPYDPNLPPNLDPSKGGGGVAGKNSNPWNKLTTELLPLDTQIPLQMMSDSALNTPKLIVLYLQDDDTYPRSDEDQEQEGQKKKLTLVHYGAECSSSHS
ncbi:hypothetical protein TYRP_003808 [Tyrophagus putrescentiae]|nr:hypothetical protein TYRP_003808 [Tyrophagus putrescentiae]